MKHRYRPEEVLPHVGPMMLIEEIVDWDTEWITTRIDRSKTSLFDLPDQTSSSVAALEYLGQSAGAHAGIRQLEDGKPVQIGFIIGARLFEVDPVLFQRQSTFTVHVEETFRDPGGIGLYHARLFDQDHPDTTVAQATIKAAMPDDPEQVFRRTMLRPS